MTARERPVALAVVAALESEIGEGRVGYAQAPPGVGWGTVTSPSITTPFVGYAVVFPGWSRPTGGSVASPREVVDQTVQVTYIGKTAEQADALRDRGRATLDDAALLLDDEHRTALICHWTDGQQVRRDDDTSPPLFYAVDRFTVVTD